MELDKVLAIFMKLSGLSEKEAEEYRYICENAVRSLRARLKDNIDESESGDSLNTAAAALAFKRYVQQDSALGGSGSFKIGEITVNSSETVRLASAENIWNEALYDIMELLRDDGFVFGRIV